jgi:hypothetical protein
MKKPTKRKEYITICPKCRSIDVRTDKSNPLTPAFGLPSLYICNRCGHSSVSFPQVDIDRLEDFKAEAPMVVEKSRRKEEIVDTRFGENQVRVFWKVTSPIMILVSSISIFYTMRAGGSPRMLGYIGGVVCLALGTFMLYISYFKKRKLR